MISKIAKEIVRPLWMALVGNQLYALREENKRIQRKLSMKDDIWRINDIVFYVPNYPIDFVQSEIVDHNRFFEQDILEQLSDHIPDNAVILDIGANIGNHSIYWSNFCSVSKIYCFEPVLKTFEILKKNVELNGLSGKVEIFNIGLGDECTNASFERFASSDIGGTSIKKDSAGAMKIELLDNINLGEEKIDFIKMDVEGYEIKALCGAEQTINKYKPTIFIEIFPRNYNMTKSLLESWGYKIEKEFSDYNYLFVF